MWCCPGGVPGWCLQPELPWDDIPDRIVRMPSKDNFRFHITKVPLDGTVHSVDALLTYITDQQIQLVIDMTAPCATTARFLESRLRLQDELRRRNVCVRALTTLRPGDGTTLFRVLIESARDRDPQVTTSIMLLDADLRLPHALYCEFASSED